MTVDPKGKFAYVASYGIRRLYGYAIDVVNRRAEAAGRDRRLQTGILVLRRGLAPSAGSPMCPTVLQLRSDRVAAYTIDSTRGR